MFSVYFRVIRLENGLTALLISDTHSATHSVHTNSNLSTTDDDDVEDPCSDEIEDESDDDDDVDGVCSKDADIMLTGGSEEEKDGHEDSSRKYSDTRLVSLRESCRALQESRRALQELCSAIQESRSVRR